MLDRILNIVERQAELGVAPQEAHARLEEEFRRITELHREINEKLNTLIRIIDENIRKKPGNGGQPKSGPLQ